jgi:dihydropteroate synthase
MSGYFKTIFALSDQTIRIRMDIQAADKRLSLTTPQVMGILNTTPDSFSDGGEYTSVERALTHAEAMIQAGAAVVDIGGESTRPGAEDVSIDTELRRVIPIIEGIRAKHPDLWISIDTSKAEVMAQAIDAGADLINDIRALREPGALEVVAQANIPVCLMHMQGQPRVMQAHPKYHNVLDEVCAFLQERIRVCEQAGIRRENMILDPGFGFGKTLEHNYHLLSNLERFHSFKLPILVGMSRKSMLYQLLGKQPKECLAASIACATTAVMKGAQIVRVHDVEATVDAIKVIEMIKNNR